MSETYIPLIKKTRWVDLSNEHQRLRETVEKDLKSGCCENGNIQPIMLQGAFGIGKSTTLYYLFHYGWEVLHTPTFYMPLAKIVEEVKKEAVNSPTGKVENNELSIIIRKMISSQIESLKDNDWNELTDVDFPEFKGGDEKIKLTLTEYLKDFEPVELDAEKASESEMGKTVFSQEVIREALATNNIPLLLVDEFESKFYELKRIVESSGGGILRELFDQIVQSKPFLLVIGNGPASGYEVAKEKGADGNNDSETAANRRLKTMQIPFPTAELLKKKFMKERPNGYVNFIWWMSRCRPGHIQKLRDEIDYQAFSEKSFIDFINERIFKDPIDESGEDVKYLKTKYFNDLNSYIRPIAGKLLLNFEPYKIKVEDSYKDAIKDSAENFFCTDEDGLVNVEKELNPALSDDFSTYLKLRQDNDGKFGEVDYLSHLAKYFNYILSACADKNGNIAFSTACRNNKEKALATTFLVPLLELTYDFVSQYEDNDKSEIKQTKDFILDCIKHIEQSVEKESIDDDFENLNGLFEICKVKSGNDLYMQFSLRAIREFIEQPIGSPKLNYKEMSLEKKLAESNIRQSVLLTAGFTNNKIVFVPLLDEGQMDKYILRLKEYIRSAKSELHEDAAKTLRIVYFQANEKIDALKNELCMDSNGNITAIAKLKKLVFEDYNTYQFNFGGQIADFIDSLAKIVIAAGSCGELAGTNEDRTIDVNSAIAIIKNREWTKQKEVVRTIEHYSRLVNEGDTCVVKTISNSQAKEYRDALCDLICKAEDYDDNICWDFNNVIESSVTNTISKYLGLYYILENAKKKTEANPSFVKVLQMVGNHSHKLFLSPVEDVITKSFHFDQILKIISSNESNKLLASYDKDDVISKHILSFATMMKTERIATKMSDLLSFIKDDLDSHWFATYNNQLSYGSSKGKMFMTLLYLQSYVECMDFTPLRTELNTRIADKEKSLTEIVCKVSQAIDAITDLLYSKKYQRANPENMPFQGYVSALQQVSQLLANCKRILAEEPESITVFAVVSSIVWRIANITSNASTVCSQITGVLTSLNSKKERIEREYQTQINTIYQDPLTAKLISLGEQSPTGQIPRFDGDWCWWQYARYMTPKSEVSAILDAKLTPAKENTIDGNDIQKFKACLESALTASSYKTKIDDALKTCKSCKESASLYNTVNNYISELLKCE